MSNHSDYPQLFERREVAIASFSETARVRRSGKTALELASEVYSAILRKTALSPRDIDGLFLTGSLSEADRPFWSNVVADGLALSPHWLQLTDLGGASPTANIARAALAIQAGYCETALCLCMDAVSTTDRSLQGSFRSDFGIPYGDAGPISSFGLISNAYSTKHGHPTLGLARLAIAQRNGALKNPLAIRQLQRTITEDDYLESRMISDPLRLLDCGMLCDGATAILMTTARRAKALSISQPVYPIGYAERTNYNAEEPQPDILSSGFLESGPAALEQAKLRPDQIKMFHPYDDFLPAVALQLEHIGFCGAGGAGAFLEQNDLGPKGRLPINTGGGQVSAGQAGLASAGFAIVEALRQMTGQAEGRQIEQPGNAVITGIGFLQYAARWGTSGVLVVSH